MIYSKNYCTILDFYLFGCPAEHKHSSKGQKPVYEPVSNMAITLRRRGISGSYLNTLTARLKGAMKTKKYQVVKDSDDVIEKVKQLLADQDDSEVEVVCFKKSGEMSMTESLFYMIRNSLAHGSFEIRTVERRDVKIKIYEFKAAKKDKEKAFIRLTEDTLMEWISLVENFDFVQKYRCKKR